MKEIKFKTEEEYDLFADIMLEKRKKEYFETLYKVYDTEEEFIEYAVKHSPYLTKKECREAFKLLQSKEKNINGSN